MKIIVGGPLIAGGWDISPHLQENCLTVRAARFCLHVLTLWVEQASLGVWVLQSPPNFHRCGALASLAELAS
eukprot:1146284-Pelagomonas_calceolata.AAC.2